MIHVERGDPPNNFAVRSEEWMQEYIDKLVTKPDLTISQYWNNIRKKLRGDADILKTAFNYKCVFCESIIEHSSKLHVEHYKPKKLPEFRDDTFNWDNWLVACPECNFCKGSKFPLCGPEPCLINPSIEEPLIHFIFERNRIFALTNRGDQTVDLLKLNRGQLETYRDFYLMTIHSLLLLCVYAPPVYDRAREFLIWAMQDVAPYAAMIRSYLGELAPNLANPAQPHPIIELPNALQSMRDFVEANRHLTANIQ